MSDAARLQMEGFSVDAEIAALRAGNRRIGGVGVFLGCARDFSAEGAVDCIGFDAYEAMAKSELIRLRSAAIERFGLIEARIVHRLGTVAAGEDIVLIVTGAEHRAAALDACRWLIDELKAKAPIWKKEITPTGDVWVTPHP